jgi:hypothetical protein
MWKKRGRVLPYILKKLNTTQYFCRSTPQVDETNGIRYYCGSDTALNPSMLHLYIFKTPATLVEKNTLAN